MSSIRGDNGIWINTECFREEAKKFLKDKRYCDDPPGTYGYIEYWREQERRCIEGYSVGGAYITGDHYDYLNFGQIKLTQELNDREKVSKALKNKSRAAKKLVTFPDFWDSDYDYFHAVQIAKWGISEKGLEKLGLGVNIRNLDGGKHLCVGKARRKGYSFKNGKIVSNRYKREPDSISIIAAFDKKYLYPEGTMGMTSSYIDFYNEHTAWARRKTIDRQDHREDGYTITINNTAIKKGYLSQVIAITCGANPDAIRGKDGTLILMEEAGKWPGLLDAYMSTKPTVESGLYTTGQILIFGTGGGDNTNWADFEELFYNPDKYNLLAFENIWDEGSYGNSCSFFLPYYRNLDGYIDKQGNSEIEEAKAFAKIKEEEIRTASRDNNALIAHKMEYPSCPREAFARTTQSIMPTADLLDWYNELMYSKKYDGFTSLGYMGYRDGKVDFIVDKDANPLFEYPHKTDNVNGCIAMWFPPIKVDGKIPDNVYIIGHDPYAINDAADLTSLGAAYVYMNPNKLVQGDVGDRIVACYVGRPNTTDEYNKNLLMLAEYYNAQIGIESDRGDIVGYAKRVKKLQYLAPEFELGFDESISNKRVSTNRYGMRLASGKNDRRRLVGDKYIADWLIAPRGTNNDGREKLNLHTIFDPALVMELIKYGDGNFDRVSAIRILMFQMRELDYNDTLSRIGNNTDKQLDAYFHSIDNVNNSFDNFNNYSIFA